MHSLRRRERERSLFEVLLPDDHIIAGLLAANESTPLLEDKSVIEAPQALEHVAPSRRRGRLCSLAEVGDPDAADEAPVRLEQEVRANLVYRAFTRIDAGEVPDAKTILKIAGALGPEVMAQLHRQVVDVAKRAGVTRGRRFRIDTTVVETNVHYPTDSTLLQDGVRVLTRTMQRASAALGDQPGRVRNRLRSVTRRVLTIGYQARSPKTRDALIESYRKLTATTRAVLRDADTMVRRIAQRRRTAADGAAAILDRARAHLQRMRPLVERVVHQTRARLLGGDTHVPDKVLSLFEPHTTTIRKGKISKPNEFGNLVTIQESEQQIITAYEVHTGRPADVTLWTPALDRHQALFGRAPHLAAGDRGFSSAANEQAATDRGVRRVVLPRRGPKSASRRAYERQAWFRRGQRWRVGCEGRISVIKRRHGLRRCRYHGVDGMHRWVGLGVIADNLINMATVLGRRAAA